MTEFVKAQDGGVRDVFTEKQITRMGRSVEGTIDRTVPIFVVAHEISAFAQSLIGDELVECKDWAALKMPSDARRHGRCCFVAVPIIGERDSYACLFVDEPNDQPSGCLQSAVGEVRRDGTRYLGEFSPNEPILVSPEFSAQPDEAHQAALGIAMCAFVLSLINQPRIVSTPHLASRQARRAAQRGGGVALDCMHRVTWDLSKDVVAKLSRDPNFHKMPLHWRRGHYRTAMPHWSGAVQRSDAIRESEREGWWQWIEGTWVGHPAFGVKRSVHAPKMTLGRLAK